MKAKPTCPQCQGRGVLLDPDPCVSARICGCSVNLQRDGDAQAIPERYSGITLENFWEWWKRCHPESLILKELDEASSLLETPVFRDSVPVEMQNKIAGILSKCTRDEIDSAWKNIKPAQEPSGFGALKTWVSKGRKDVTLCWIDGPPGSGRSSLASAALSAWCKKFQESGLFVSVRTLSQEIKGTYYDTRSWQNADFQSERDRMAPLLSVSCLVLDDFDKVDSDIRVVRAFAQLLDHRWGEKLPTILTATKWAEVLENEALLKLDDASTLHRLSQARRVELIPTLSRLMMSV